MSKFYINLLNFNSPKLAGAGYFFKRIISNLNFDEEKWTSFDQIVVFSNTSIDPLVLFDIKISLKVKVVYIPFVDSFLLRILFEQLILPFKLMNCRDVFYSPTPAIPLLSKLLNRELILIPTIHDMIPFKIDKKYSRLRSVYVKFISKSAAKLSTCVITVSEFSKSDISQIARVEKAKIFVVYNFIPELEYKKNDHSDDYFVTVCTVEPGKNIETMLEGFRIFLDSGDQYKKFKYKIIGQFGWQFDQIFSLQKRLSLEDSVEFAGYLSDIEKNRLLNNCMAMIYLSKYEGFGIPPLEGMYFDKVSVVSNNSSLPEVVGSAGIIQDPNDARLLANNLILLTTSSQRYKENIVAQLEKFNPDVQIKKFEDIILNSLIVTK